MKALKIIYILAALSLLVACAPVHSDMDKTADFSSYHTYAWLNRTDSINNVLYDNEMIDKNVHMYVDNEMQRRGFKIDKESPDVVVRYHIMMERKESLVNDPGYMYSPFYPPYLYGGFPFFVYPSPFYVGNNFQKIVYNEGTLVVDVIDRKKNQLVWHGWSVGTFNDPTEIQARLPKDIKRIFDKFPLKPVYDKEQMEKINAGNQFPTEGAPKL